MQTTDIKIIKTFTDGNVKAIVSVTLDDCLAIHEIRIVQGYDRLFAAMPGKRDSNDIYRYIVHPISAKARDKVENIILKAYENYTKFLEQSEAK